MIQYEGNQFINIGVGKDISIKELAEKIKEVVGFKGDILFNPSKPDGTPRKLVDFTKVEYISSAGIRMIVATHRKAKELSASFSVIHVNPEVMSILAMTGLDKKISIVG